MPFGALTVVNAIVVARIDVQSAMGVILFPHHLTSTVHWCYCFSSHLGGSAKFFRKADQLIFNISYTGIDSY